MNYWRGLHWLARVELATPMGISAETREPTKHKTENEDKEARERLAAMTIFPLGGFGFFNTRLGMGTYNLGRKTTIPRRYDTAKDALWGAGLRAPIGNRIARDAAALTLGTLNADRPVGEFVTLGDCIPRSADTYDAFAPGGKKYEPLGKSHHTIGTSVRSFKGSKELFFVSLVRETSENGWGGRCLSSYS